MATLLKFHISSKYTAVQLSSAQLDLERKKTLTVQEKKRVIKKTAGWGVSEALLIGLHIPRTLVLLSGTLQSLPPHKCQMFLLPTFSISSPAHNNRWCRSGSARRWLTSLMTADSTCWSIERLCEITLHVCPPLHNNTSVFHKPKCTGIFFFPLWSQKEKNYPAVRRKVPRWGRGQRSRWIGCCLLSV